MCCTSRFFLCDLPSMEMLTGNRPSIRSKAVLLSGWGMRISTRELSLAMISIASSSYRWSSGDCSLLFASPLRWASLWLLYVDVSFANKPSAVFLSLWWGWANTVWQQITCSGEAAGCCSGHFVKALLLRDSVLHSSSAWASPLLLLLGMGIEASGVSSLVPWQHRLPLMSLSLCSQFSGPSFSRSWNLEERRHFLLRHFLYHRYFAARLSSYRIIAIIFTASSWIQSPDHLFIFLVKKASLLHQPMLFESLFSDTYVFWNKLMVKNASSVPERRI